MVRPIAQVASIIVLIAATRELASAQALASEKGSVSQTVDGTTITVEYYRPAARGRVLFGKQVRWDEEWTPGANWATTLEVDRDVRIDNQPLPKGKYSVWMIAQNDKPWTVVLSKRDRLFHMRPPPSSEDQIRFTVKPEQGPESEMLTWSFPRVVRDGAALTMHWGTTVVPMQITVDQSRHVTLSAAERAAFVGTFVVTFEARPGAPTTPETIELFDTPNGLRSRTNLLEPESYDATVDFAPIGDNQFHPVYSSKGAVIGMEPAETFAFKLEGDRAVSFEVVGTSGRAYAHGKRKP
ncbi:MAG: DUF2911 domain-containing protein [Gemmatimonadaceae bacterium]